MRTPLIFVLLASAATAQTIDFETYPNGGVTGDTDEVTSDYSSFGVTFSLVRHRSSLVLPLAPIQARPKIAKIGAPRTAFEGVGGGSNCPDQPLPSFEPRIGAAFLTDGESLGLTGDLLISYATPVESASGDLLDVDIRGSGQYEEWTVYAFDAAFGIVGQVTIRGPGGSTVPEACGQGQGSGNGTAVSFTIESVNHAFDISHLFFLYTGTADGVGIAFDNFTPSTNVCTNGWERIGDPCRGSAVLTGHNCLVAGGTVRFDVDASAADAGAHGCLLVSTSNPAASFLGCPVFVDVRSPLTVLPHALDAAGSFSLTVTMPPVLSSPEYFLQSIYMPRPGGIFFTNGIRGRRMP